MAYKIVMPQLGLTMEEGSVTSWLKQPGEYVEKGEALLPWKPTRLKWKSSQWGRAIWERSKWNSDSKFRLSPCSLS